MEDKVVADMMWEVELNKRKISFNRFQKTMYPNRPNLDIIDNNAE